MAKGEAEKPHLFFISQLIVYYFTNVMIARTIPTIS